MAGINLGTEESPKIDEEQRQGAGRVEAVMMGTCPPKIFADNLMNGLIAKKKEDLIIAMKNSSSKLGVYCNRYFLQLNSSKTHMMAMGDYSNIAPPPMER